MDLFAPIQLFGFVELCGDKVWSRINKLVCFVRRFPCELDVRGNLGSRVRD